MQVLRFRAVDGVLFPDPASPGRFLGRTTMTAPVDGWPAGTKKLDIHPIDPMGGVVERKDKVRWLAVWDALRKGIDLLPMEEPKAKRVDGAGK